MRERERERERERWCTHVRENISIKLKRKKTEPQAASKRAAAGKRRRPVTEPFMPSKQCDQIGRFIGLWATF